MKKSTKEKFLDFVTIVIFFSLLGFVVHGYWYWRNEALTKKNKVAILSDITMIKCPECPTRKFLWEEIMEEVAYTNDYDVLIYNCWDYTTDLYRRLKEAGFISKIAMGTLDNIPHTWIELMIPIEATTGEIIPFDVYQNNYRLGYYGIEKHNYLR